MAERGAADVPPSGSGWASRGGIGVASAASAALTWVLQLIAGHVLGVGGYARFMVLWGLFFTVVGILQGLQQEVTRSAVSAKGGVAGARVVKVAGVVGSAGAVALICAWLLGAGQDPAGGVEVMVVAIACLLYALGTALNGALAAQQAWGTYAWAVALEGVGRAVVFIVAIWLSRDLAVLAVGLTGGVLAWVLLLSGSRPMQRAWRSRGDVTAPRMVLGAVQAMAATGCSALLISGFPLLLSQTSSRGEERTAGVLLAVLVATRTPLLLFLNAYQGPILTHLMTVPSPLRLLGRWSAYALVIGVVGGVAGYVVGSPLIRLAFGPGFRAPPSLFPSLVAAAVALTLLTITGWALVARAHHTMYLFGWVLATIGTVVVLALGGPIEHRAPLALVVGPLIGIALHLVVLVSDRSSTSRVGAVVSS